MPTSLSDAVHQTERALLGSILLDSSLWLQIDSLGAQDFGLEAHRRIYGRMAAMFEDQRPVDIVTLTLELAQLDQLAACGDAGYLASLLEHAFPENFSAYVRTVRESSRDRRYSHLLESLSRSAKTDDRLAKLEQMQALLREESLDTDPSSSVAVVRMLSEVEAKKVDWLKEPYIPKGMLTMLTGDPGVGKSFIALGITADVARRGGKTVYLTIENSAAYTLRPRFDALKGDASKLILLEGISAQGITRSVTLRDIEVLDKTLGEHKPELVVIDPIQSYLGAGVDAHRSNETRPILDGLAKLAEKHHVAVLILRHASKNGSGRAIYRGLGSIDFTGAVRCELFAGETLEKQRAVCHIKSNIGPIGPAQGYEITPADEQGRVWSAGYFRWTGDTQIEVADLTEPEETNGGASAGAEAEKFLRDMLGEGPKPAKGVLREARDAGIAERTLERAKSKLRVDSRKGANGWEWVLPAEKAPRAPSTNLGGLESSEAHKQHTINNIGKDAKTAKSVTLRGAGDLDGNLEPRPKKSSFGCPDCGAAFDSSAGWAKHSVDGCGRA
jgi:hypothetical protein